MVVPLQVSCSVPEWFSPLYLAAMPLAQNPVPASYPILYFLRQSAKSAGDNWIGKLPPFKPPHPEYLCASKK
jgi:hypothetical protein